MENLLFFRNFRIILFCWKSILFIKPIRLCDSHNELAIEIGLKLSTQCCLWKKFFLTPRTWVSKIVVTFHNGSYEKDLRAKIFRRKFFEKLFYKLSEILKGWTYWNLRGHYFTKSPTVAPTVIRIMTCLTNPPSILLFDSNLVPLKKDEECQNFQVFNEALAD